MKTIFKIFCFIFYFMLIFGFGYLCGRQARHYPDPFKTITEQMKSIQRQVGCKLIDAKIGKETRRLVNAQVEKEERELFNQYAAAYIEAPEIIEETK